MSIEVKPNFIKTFLSQSTLALAQTAAEQSAEKYSKRVRNNKAPYQNNSVERHFIGKVGEFGVAQIFQELSNVFGREITVERVFANDTRDSECDVIANGLRIEVKTWKPWAYNTYGPCIADKQAKKLHKKCDVVIYAVYDERTKSFSLMGWNTVTDLEGVEAEYTGTEGKQVFNRCMTARSIIELPILSHQQA